MANVSPGYSFTSTSDPITSAKLNLLGQPTVTLGSGEVDTTALANNLTITGLTLGSTLIGSVDALSGAGAIPITTLTTKLTTTGANALTLANGSNGQFKIITMVADGGDGTLAPTTKTGFSTVTFNDVGDSVTLQYFTTLGWMIQSNYGCTIA